MKKVPKLRFPEFEGEWEEKKIAEIFDKVRNSVDVIESEKYKQIGVRSHGKGIFYKEEVSGKELGNKRVFWIEPDVFIVNIVFAWEQAVARTTQKELGMIASHRFPMYKPKSELLDLDFITYFFKTAKGKFKLELASPGGAGRNKTLGQNEFENLDVNLPSFSEQRKIAELLCLVDKKIEKQQKKIEALQEYNADIMQKIFLQEIRFKDETGEDYPDWEDKKLNHLGDTYTGLSGKTKENFGIGNAQYIVYKNVFTNIVAKSELVELVELNNNESQNKVAKGDLLFTTSSETPNEVGMVSCWNYDIDNIYLNSFCFGYRLFDKEKYSPIFMAYLLRSEEYRKKIFILAQGSTRYNISKNELMKIMVAIPHINEQNKIVEFLSGLYNKTEKEQEKLEQLIQLKKGLLQQLFV